MRKDFDAEGLARRAKEASRVLAKTPTAVKDRALREMAKALRRRAKKVLAANKTEVAAARAAGRTAAFVDRLTLTPERLEGVAAALEKPASAQHCSRLRVPQVLLP